VRIAFLLTRHPPDRVSPIIPGAIELLRQWKAHVSVIYPEETLIDLSRVHVDHDLYVLKSARPLSLSLAGALDTLGATILNPIGVTLRCRDKVVATRLLRTAGVPVPETWIAATARDLAEIVERGPIVVKPSRGSGGEGVTIVRDQGGLESVAPSDGFVFAQRYHEPRDRDHKLYRIGDELFGVRRIWPARTYEEKLGEPFEPDAELANIARQCGDAFGIDLYGVDVVVSDDGPVVVDVSAFPGFKGVPDTAFRLARYIRAAAGRAAEEIPAVPRMADAAGSGR
jgi:ribosomal protein S6--L-glutamate ligase